MNLLKKYLALTLITGVLSLPVSLVCDNGIEAKTFSEQERRKLQALLRAPGREKAKNELFKCIEAKVDQINKDKISSEVVARIFRDKKVQCIITECSDKDFDTRVSFLEHVANYASESGHTGVAYVINFHIAELISTEVKGFDSSIQQAGQRAGQRQCLSTLLRQQQAMMNDNGQGINQLSSDFYNQPEIQQLCEKCTKFFDGDKSKLLSELAEYSKNKGNIRAGDVASVFAHEQSEKTSNIPE